MKERTCVMPTGQFCWGVHRPGFEIKNLRARHDIRALGRRDNEEIVNNRVNFPEGNVRESAADWIFEVPNPFPFRGVTFICKSWADEKAANPEKIALPARPEVSLKEALSGDLDKTVDPGAGLGAFIERLPDPLRLALAATSTDPDDLTALAHCCCEFDWDAAAEIPVGLRYRDKADGRTAVCITDRPLFETLANNPHLPDVYKEVMVLRPGVQGSSEITGDWQTNDGRSHVFEYLRRNSYIPWGHFAANMAHDAVRYSVQELTIEDMTGLRHLYYQRTVVRLAEQCGIGLPAGNGPMTVEALEAVRKRLLFQISEKEIGHHKGFNRTLWGWNYGFDFAPSHYRLHASHQQIHQQFALIPAEISVLDADPQVSNLPDQMPAYACGDLVADFIERYRSQTGTSFFDCYLHAIRSNRRTDGSKNGPSSLVVFEDDDVMLFVPKAQTSQWELQLMTKQPLGNVLETDRKVRQSIDRTMLLAVRILAGLGARMITSIEYSKPFDAKDSDQRLLYAFLPKLPESPGAFSEAQLRWINGHYPEDFAEACRLQRRKAGIA